MKIRFSIEYRTEWGQQLVVCLNYRLQDDTVRSSRLPMLTQDGAFWTAETAVLENRRSPIQSFTYLYVVEDADGNELRREWNLVPRTYAFDPSKTYIMDDRWRDLPLNSHLYTAAYAVTSGERAAEGATPDTGKNDGVVRLPLFRKTVLFRVSAPQLVAGQSLAVIGSHPALGSWNPMRYLLMERAGEKDWMLTLNVDWLGEPIEYKYVVIDDAKHELLAWEEGDNRIVATDMVDGEVLVAYGEPLRLPEKPWRLAGVCVPVFALRSESSFGVGDFGDLRRFVDWAAATGMKVIQLLPVNDTNVTGQWGDSHPYSIVSTRALHPHYIDLGAFGPLADKQLMTVFSRRQRELNALPYSDYEVVDRVKGEYFAELFRERGEEMLASADFRAWEEANVDWLEALDEFHQKPEGDPAQHLLQYHLHCQLKAAADYARSRGIFLVGDLPVGVNRHSAETMASPDHYNLDMQAGTPPDATSVQGHNWGFPTYRWSAATEEAFRQRLHYMETYFDGLRIDHVPGYFRIWQIPVDQLYATMGHYAPALPLTPADIEYFGLSFRREFLTRPFINDRIIDQVFGIHAQYVRDTYLTLRGYGLYDLHDEVATQRRVQACFEGRTDEHSLWIRDGLCRLVANVLLLEDPQQPDTYHPRILAFQEPVFQALSLEEREAYMRLYNNYFYQRNTLFWGQTGYERLHSLFGSTSMLVCAEDLGAMPDGARSVLDSLRLLTLEIQQMPKERGLEYAYLDGNPVRSVATITTHDMAPLRLWWEENPERAQRYYTTMLQKQGRAPQHLPAHLAEEIIARHLYCPSMLCILSLQDWLAMDGELRSPDPRQERINVPGQPDHRWQWRMHLTIEQLMQAERFNARLKTMIARSRR